MIGVAEAALAGILTGAWLGAAWWLWQRRGGAAAVVPMVLAAGPVAMVAVVLAAPPIWHAAARGYPGDSLFTLSPAAIAGVVALSFGLIALFFLVMTWKSVWLAKRAPAGRVVTAGLDVLAGLALFGLLHALSRQAYYAFYRAIIPDLPDQWVIRLDWDRLAAISRLPADASLSQHLSGVTLWAVVPLTVWVHIATLARAPRPGTVATGGGAAALILQVWI